MLVLRNLRERLPSSRRHQIQLAAAAEGILEAQKYRSNILCLIAVETPLFQ
jgi:hypothetical protein